MFGKSLRIVMAVVVGALLLGACSSGGGEEGEGGTEKCDGNALSSDQIKLPADFPIPGEAVLTDSTSAGPSQVVEGYYEADLDSAYREWKEALDGAGYSILFDEIEDKDSEISYKSADESSTGQIALRSDCEEGDRTFVHITNRPS
jgi:hypothetical protein